MEPDDLLCSRNARPEKALVGRAQWKTTQPPSLKRERASLEGPSLFARCGLACGTARPGAKSLSWQTQGGWVKSPPGLGGSEPRPF
jgi:hypothetical protein